MLLSKVVEVSGSTLVQWSPDGSQLAMGKEKRLVVRSASMGLKAYFTCEGPVEAVQWSPDGELVLAAVYNSDVVHVRRPAEPEWQCTITDDLGGLVAVRWSPCSRHVVTLSDFNLHACVWSLVDLESRSFIAHPKTLQAGLSFTRDGRFAALLQRETSKDSMGIFSIGEAWKPLRHFDLATQDAAAVSWSPTSGALCVADTALSYKVLAYSPDGELLAQFCAYEDALGVRSHCWSPRGNFLSVGSFDGVVRTLDSASWAVISSVQAESLTGSVSKFGSTGASAAAAAAADDDGSGGGGASSGAAVGGVGGGGGGNVRPLLFQEVYDHELSEVDGVQAQFVSVVTDRAGATAAGVGASEAGGNDDGAEHRVRTIVSSCLVCVEQLSGISWQDLNVENHGVQVRMRTCLCVRAAGWRLSCSRSARSAGRVPGELLCRRGRDSSVEGCLASRAFCKPSTASCIA
jgi:WD40 repeat protein